MSQKFKNPRLGVLASGSGTNFNAILKAIERSELPATAAVLISNNPSAGSIKIAKSNDIPVEVITEPKESRDQKIADILKQYNVDVVVLAGWLKLLTAPVLKAFPDHIINIHPGPLPRFGGSNMYGLYVHEAVIKAGLKETYPSVHLVNEVFDAGKILGYGEKIPVLADDTPETLQDREKRAEYDFYWRVIKSHFCQ